MVRSRIFYPSIFICFNLIASLSLLLFGFMSVTLFVASLLIGFAIAVFVYFAIQNSLVAQEQQLFASENRYQAIIDHARIGIAHLDKDGQFIESNPALCQMTSFSPSELQGRKFSSLTHRDDVDKYSKLYNQLIQGSIQHFNLEKRFLTKNGEILWVFLTCSSVRDKEGNITCFVAILEDISEMKTVERNLRDTKEQAEAANRAKSSFLATMSHEMRTPMNVLIGMGELLAETNLSVKQSGLLEISNRSSETLMALLNDILDISKIEAGQLELDNSPFHLQELVVQTAEILQAKADNNKNSVVCQFDNHVPQLIMGDAQRLRQILLNLIGNAIKFTHNGNIVISVTIESKDEISFVVKDTGIGIPSEMQNAIFKPFSQADSTITRRFGGTGLGLAICKQLIEKMGGRIWVESVPHKGSSFFFNICSLEVLTPSSSVRLKESEGRRYEEMVKKHNPDGSKLKILLVDDSEDNCILIQAFLKGLYKTLDVASNGIEAVEMFKPNYYDLILMDIQMPLMDGHMATRKIREREHAEGSSLTPIIALTANAMKEDMQKSMDAGCNFHVTKPIKKGRLVEIIKKIELYSIFEDVG